MSLTVGSSSGSDGCTSEIHCCVAWGKALHDGQNLEESRLQNYRRVRVVIHSEFLLRSRTVIENRQCTYCGILIWRKSAILTEKRLGNDGIRLSPFRNCDRVCAEHRLHDIEVIRVHFERCVVVTPRVRSENLQQTHLSADPKRSSASLLADLARIAP